MRRAQLSIKHNNIKPRKSENTTNINYNFRRGALSQKGIFFKKLEKLEPLERINKLQYALLLISKSLNRNDIKPCFINKIFSKFFSVLKDNGSNILLHENGSKYLATFIINSGKLARDKGQKFDNGAQITSLVKELIKLNPNSQEIANSIYGLGLLVQSGVNIGFINKEVIESSVKRLSSLHPKPQEIGNTIYALGILSQSRADTLIVDSELIQSLVMQLASLEHKASQDISNLIYGLGLMAQSGLDMSYIDANLINCLIEELPSLQANNQAISNSIYGIGLMAASGFDTTYINQYALDDLLAQVGTCETGFKALSQISIGLCYLNKDIPEDITTQLERYRYKPQTIQTKICQVLGNNHQLRFIEAEYLLGGFFVDVYIETKDGRGFVIEIDGLQHLDEDGTLRPQDSNRDSWLEQHFNLKVLRFTRNCSDDILVTKINKAIGDKLTRSHHSLYINRIETLGQSHLDNQKPSLFNFNLNAVGFSPDNRGNILNDKHLTRQSDNQVRNNELQKFGIFNSKSMATPFDIPKSKENILSKLNH